MTAVVLHLSDIHIKNAADPILQRAESIASCTFSALPTCSHVFIVVSGDIVFAGKADQYELAATFFHKIKTRIQSEKYLPVSYLIVPGNHDCDFELDNRTRQIVIKHLAEEGAAAVDDSVIDQCVAVQRAFFDFRTSVEESDSVDNDKLWWTQRFEVEGKTLAFDGLNVSWMSKQKEQGVLVFPFERYSKKQNDGADIRILVMHHPLNWFGQATYRPFRAFIRKLANVVITGHEHQGNVGENVDSESAHSAYIEGCVLQGERNLTDSSFNLIVLDLGEGKYRSTHYSWNDELYESSELGSWADFRELPAKARNPFEIRQDIRNILDDPGAYFKHPGHTRIALSDIFIFPDMSDMRPEVGKREILSSSILRDPLRTHDGVMIEAEEKVGCTSLLYRLYDEYHDRGFVPVYLRGKDLNKTTDRDITTIIKHAITQQYGADALARFEQLPRAKKLLLLDDFDECPIRASKGRADAIRGLRGRFQHIVIAVGALFEIQEMMTGANSDILREFHHYRLLHFGFALRTKLTQRWFRLASDGTLDDATMLARWDQAEKLIEAVMQRNIIPSAPLFLLTLLQSIDAGRSGDFKESALGFYYEYLLTEGFLAAGVAKDKLSEHFEYSTRLAWFYHTKKQRDLSDFQLREFNDFFSTKYQSGDFATRIDMLVRAKVLVRRGADYFFRYPYAYYFLKGRYLSQHLQEPEIKAYITHCCKHLYVRENANTILFLAHHTNDDFMIRAIVDALRALFPNLAPITFEGDTQAVAELIDNAPKLEYSGEKPEEHRERVSKLRDEIDDGKDGLAEREEDSEHLSLFAQLTVLFKTIDILGQILKNQYARIERSRKVELIADLFSGPLRSLRSLYDYIEKNPDYLVAEIDAALEKRHKLSDIEKRRRLAKQIVASIVQMISYGFIQKASNSVNGEALFVDVHEAVKKNGTLAFRLIESGLMLDSPAPLPREMLRKLMEDGKKDMVISRIVQMQVLQRLYMFRTTEADRQWLSSKDGLQLNLAFQQAVEFKTVKSKKLKPH